MKKILCIDFDETLTNEVCFTNEEVLKATPKQDIIDKINKLYEEDFIIIYTARRDRLITDSLTWLRKHNVRFHAISNNKIPSDQYVDDKALHIKDL